MNLVQRLLALLNTSELLERLSAMIGESTQATEKGLTAAAPAIFGGLIARGSSESGANSLINLMRENNADGGMLDQLAQLFGGRARDAQIDAGYRMLHGILGEKTDAAASLVSSASGMSENSASNLMALATPAVVGGLAGAAPAGGFSAAGLMSLLESQRAHLETSAPPGLVDLLGIGGVGAATLSMAGAASSATRWASTAVGIRSRASVATAPRAAAVALTGPSFLQLLWPWLALAALLLFALFGLRACLSSTPRVAEAPPVLEPVAAETPAAQPVTDGQLSLPSGALLTVPPGSVGENLYNFLTSSETGSKTFLFDGLTFETGQATLGADSQATIAAIAEILKAFDAVSVSVDGYTDNIGAREENLRLSEARAQEVLAALVAAGVDSGRMKAAGHADDNPVADNRTEEGRALNRRTELTATKN